MYFNNQELLRIQNPAQLNAGVALRSGFTHDFNFYFVALGEEERNERDENTLLARDFSKKYINNIHRSENIKEITFYSKLLVVA